ncbi:hypothetical protein ACFL3N_01550 [Candidatus Omnitrophota bacterium]
MSVVLENWLSIGKLLKHKTNKEEIDAIFGVIERCLKDASLKGLSSDQKYILSYQAVFEAGLAMLYCSGYRPIKAGHHYIVWQCLKEIFDKEYHKTILLFEGAAKKRSKLSYDKAGLASQQEADEMYKEAVEFIRHAKINLKTTTDF